mmetsp:Transcript_18081/g.26877  ORF Transcript_18081/g.26877 Transcript_18081/m.26877 type:complete len:119 (-) Transcript_18081:16-372(-)
MAPLSASILLLSTSATAFTTSNVYRSERVGRRIATTTTTLGVLEKPRSIIAEILDRPARTTTTIDPPSSTIDDEEHAQIDWNNRDEIIGVVREKIGGISEDRVMYPEMNSGEVPRMFR